MDLMSLHGTVDYKRLATATENLQVRYHHVSQINKNSTCVFARYLGNITSWQCLRIRNVCESYHHRAASFLITEGWNGVC